MVLAVPICPAAGSSILRSCGSELAEFVLREVLVQHLCDTCKFLPLEVLRVPLGTLMVLRVLHSYSSVYFKIPYKVDLDHLQVDHRSDLDISWGLDIPPTNDRRISSGSM